MDWIEPNRIASHRIESNMRLPHLYGNGVGGGVSLDGVHHNVGLGVAVLSCNISDKNSKDSIVSTGGNRAS